MLWSSDGTAAGTRPLLDNSIRPVGTLGDGGGLGHQRAPSL